MPPETPGDLSKFRGLIDKKDVQGLKERRFDNAQEVKKRYSSINKEWTDQYYVNWVEKVQDRFGAENIEISLSKHQNNQYNMNNSTYRNRFISRLGRHERTISPTF
jgi:hypothetical protein